MMPEYFSNSKLNEFTEEWKKYRPAEGHILPEEDPVGVFLLGDPSISPNALPHEKSFSNGRSHCPRAVLWLDSFAVLEW